MYSNRLQSLQALRGFAASAVVFHHAVEATLPGPEVGSGEARLREFAWLGILGVDVFFVISGFIMMYAHFDDFGKTGAFSSFWAKRLVRIVPTYWMLTAVATIVLILAPQLSQHGREVDIPWITASFLFVPWTSSTGIPTPVLGLGWTLNYEMYFYLVFSITLLMPRNRALSLIFGFFVLSILLGHVVETEGAFVTQATNWLLAEFLLGVCLGVMFRKGRAIPNSIGILLISVASMLLILALLFKESGTLLSIQRFGFMGIAAACIVSVMTMTPWSRTLSIPKPVLLVGDASYSLYLTHVFTLPALMLIMGHLQITLPGWLQIIVLVTVSILVAVAFYKIFERPTLRFLRKRSMALSERHPA